MGEIIFYGFNRSLKVRTMSDSSLTPIEDKAGRVVQNCGKEKRHKAHERLLLPRTQRPGDKGSITLLSQRSPTSPVCNVAEVVGKVVGQSKESEGRAQR